MKKCVSLNRVVFPLEGTRVEYEEYSLRIWSCAVCSYQRFAETCCLQLQGRGIGRSEYGRPLRDQYSSTLKNTIFCDVLLCNLIEFTDF
jgi:hypothetical protein